MCFDINIIRMIMITIGSGGLSGGGTGIGGEEQSTEVCRWWHTQHTYSGTLWHSRHIVRIAVGWMCESPDAISQYQAFFYPNFSNFKIIPINNLVCCFLFAWTKTH